MKNSFCRRRPKKPEEQRGMVLVITLIILVAMTLAAVGMVRSVDTSVVAVGNLSARQAADVAVNKAIEVVVKSLTNKKLADLRASGGAIGSHYYASSEELSHNEKGIPSNLLSTAGSGAHVSLEDDAGNITRTVVERMCTTVGQESETLCVGRSVGVQFSLNKTNELDMRGLGSNLGFSPFYRVTVRVDGANGNVSFAQAILDLK